MFNPHYGFIASNFRVRSSSNNSNNSNNPKDFCQYVREICTDRLGNHIDTQRCRDLEEFCKAFKEKVEQIKGVR